MACVLALSRPGTMSTRIKNILCVHVCVFIHSCMWVQINILGYLMAHVWRSEDNFCVNPCFHLVWANESSCLCLLYCQRSRGITGNAMVPSLHDCLKSVPYPLSHLISLKAGCWSFLFALVFLVRTDGPWESSLALSLCKPEQKAPLCARLREWAWQLMFPKE